MLSLALAILLGLIIASPQLMATWNYYPLSIRTQQTYATKTAIGNVSLKSLWIALFCPRNRARLDGVHFPEMTASIGYVGILLACLAPLGWWHVAALVFALLAMGKYTPFFRWTQWVHLRLPCRYLYPLSLCLVMLATTGLMQVSQYVDVRIVTLLVVLQTFDLLMNGSAMLPMTPWVQRWNRPSRVFCTPLTTLLANKNGLVSGLPYPLRTGHINRIQTLGYTGGAALKAKMESRGITDPNGQGAHDWFETGLDGPEMDRYCIEHAYTYRHLQPPRWKPTSIAHLYENTCYGTE